MIPLGKNVIFMHLHGRGSVLLVPRDCKQYFWTQYYDYPYILRHNDYKVHDKPLDVVYISEGEKNADINYNRLKKLCPRAKRNRS